MSVNTKRPALGRSFHGVDDEVAQHGVQQEFLALGGEGVVLVRSAAVHKHRQDQAARFHRVLQPIKDFARQGQQVEILRR